VGLRKQVLVDWVETYVQLTEQDALELQRLLDLGGNEEIKAMELTWLGQAEARGMEKGIEQGIQKGIKKGIKEGIAQGAETATRQAVGRMRRVVLRQIEQRFGAVPTKMRRKIEAIDSLEPLADLAERVLVVDSVGELGLD
jgi:flagellar biosynthesis/type III secretory pathway protein FliH